MATTTETVMIMSEPLLLTVVDDTMDTEPDKAREEPHAITVPSASSQQFPFFALPAELRTQIYEELLVTNASFRLGHHGPFCLVPRKPTYPAILRASRRVLEEAAPVLYGANSFFLGTIGFKPIYSFSFISSIGKDNASLIRKLVAHSTYPKLTTRSHLQMWIDGLGIDFGRLKVLAVSFEQEGMEVKSLSVPQQPQIGAPLVQMHGPMGNYQVPPANSTLQSQHGAPVLNITSGLGLGATAAMAVSVATHGAQNAVGQLGVTSNAVWQAANNVVSSVLATQNWPPLPSTNMNVPTAVIPSASTGHTPNASVSTTPSVFLPGTREDDGQYETCARREQLWLQKANTKMVQTFANVPNCDLRAGECWLMYRDPRVRKLPGAS